LLACLPIICDWPEVQARGTEARAAPPDRGHGLPAGAVEEWQKGQMKGGKKEKGNPDRQTEAVGLTHTLAVSPGYSGKYLRKYFSWLFLTNSMVLITNILSPCSNSMYNMVNLVTKWYLEFGCKQNWWGVRKIIRYSNKKR
jgi:hypothetical protein